VEASNDAWLPDAAVIPRVSERTRLDGAAVRQRQEQMHFIFEVHVKPGYTAEQYAEAWVRASKIIQQAPGARGTRLHRKIGDPSVLLAIATWETKAARDAMEATQHERVKAIISEQAEFVDVRLLGEFEEPEWVVLPET